MAQLKKIEIGPLKDDFDGMTIQLIALSYNEEFGWVCEEIIAGFSEKEILITLRSRGYKINNVEIDRK